MRLSSNTKSWLTVGGMILSVLTGIGLLILVMNLLMDGYFGSVGSVAVYSQSTVLQKYVHKVGGFCYEGWSQDVLHKDGRVGNYDHTYWTLARNSHRSNVADLAWYADNCLDPAEETPHYPSDDATTQ